MDIVRGLEWNDGTEAERQFLRFSFMVDKQVLSERLSTHPNVWKTIRDRNFIANSEIECESSVYDWYDLSLFFGNMKRLSLLHEAASCLFIGSRAPEVKMHPWKSPDNRPIGPPDPPYFVKMIFHFMMGCGTREFPFDLTLDISHYNLARWQFQNGLVQRIMDLTKEGPYYHEGDLFRYLDMMDQFKIAMTKLLVHPQRDSILTN